MPGAARVLLLMAALTGGPASAAAPDHGTAASQDAAVSIQIVNPQAGTVLRLLLDRKVIFESATTGTRVANTSTAPAVVGTFALAAAAKHVLVAEVPGTATKAQLEWMPRRDGGTWVVVHYDPGRQAADAPPFFTFALQANSYKAR